MIQRSSSSLRKGCISKLNLKPSLKGNCLLSRDTTNKDENSSFSIAELNQSIGIRSFHSTISRKDSSLIIGGAGLLVASVVAQQVFKYYQNKNEVATKETTTTEDSKTNAQSSSPSSSTSKADSSSSTAANNNSNSNSTSSTNPNPGKPVGFFASFFARTFYEGGFEPKMTRREAALVLGVRESSPVERIKDAHRRILLLNHPDRGGSAFIAAKVNEAKDLLMKGKDGK